MNAAKVVKTVLSNYNKLDKDKKREIFKVLLKDPAIKEMTGLDKSDSKKGGAKEVAKSADDASEAALLKGRKALKKSFLPTLGGGIVDAFGTGVEAAGDIYGAKESLLGDALLAMTGLYNSPGYVNPAASGMAPIAAAQKAKGYGFQRGGQAVNDAIHAIKDPLERRADENRSIELLLTEKPNTGYYDLQRHRESVLDKTRRK